MKRPAREATACRRHRCGTNRAMCSSRLRGPPAAWPAVKRSDERYILCACSRGPVRASETHLATRLEEQGHSETSPSGHQRPPAQTSVRVYRGTGPKQVDREQSGAPPSKGAAVSDKATPALPYEGTTNRHPHRSRDAGQAQPPLPDCPETGARARRANVAGMHLGSGPRDHPGP